MKHFTAILVMILVASAQDKPVNPAVLKAKQEFEAKKAEAAKGDPAAVYELGDLHYFGKGTPRNYAEALKAYTQAAEAGYVLAEANLGYLYERGQGATKDYKKAMEWYTKAANKGHAEAQVNLGEMYYSGKGLPKRDFATAWKWYAIAAELGHKDAKLFAPRAAALLREPQVTAEQKAGAEAAVKAWMDEYKKKQ